MFVEGYVVDGHVPADVIRRSCAGTIGRLCRETAYYLC
jgi:hypothetical protein